MYNLYIIIFTASFHPRLFHIVFIQFFFTNFIRFVFLFECEAILSYETYETYKFVENFPKFSYKNLKKGIRKLRNGRIFEESIQITKSVNFGGVTATFLYHFIISRFVFKFYTNCYFFYLLYF